MKEKKDYFLKVKKDYFKLLYEENIFSKDKKSEINNLKNHYMPMSFWIENKYKKKGQTLFLGLSGAQGSGKTTIGKILKIIFKTFFKRDVLVISIDDFYKTLKERNKLAIKIHPLFITRGVPGTHDTHSLKKFFQNVNSTKFKKIKLPKFDKSKDDRSENKYFYEISKKPEIIILEGWCVGAKSQSLSQIKKPVNILEEREDKDLIWRKYVNEKLKKEYKKIFSMIDHFIFIKIPNFNKVLKWRFLQETKLRKKFKSHKKIMTYSEIKRFIMFYQRITLQMIKDLSKSASMVLFLGKNHEIKKVTYR